MKRITAIILATACVVGCSWDVQADDTIIVESPVIAEMTAKQACEAGVELHDDGVTPSELIEFLAYAQLTTLQKQGVAACYSEAMKDER